MTMPGEVVLVDEILIRGDSIKIKMPVFEGYKCSVYRFPFLINGFIKESLQVSGIHKISGKAKIHQ